jgi:hypothetical protein
MLHRRTVNEASLELPILLYRQLPGTHGVMHAARALLLSGLARCPGQLAMKR